jgi:diguanylate cyclase (GGDEF)-like protein
MSTRSAALLFLRLHRYLNARRPLGLMGWSLLLLVVIGVLDLLAGAEVSFSIFYITPIFLATWYGGKGVGHAVCILSVLAWLVIELGSGLAYSHMLSPVWNTLVMLGFFLITAKLVLMVRERLEREALWARTDPLTGLVNARFFYERLAAESERASRYGHPFTLVYMDMDNFKEVNDTRGHPAGDALLRETAEVLRNHVRQSDLLARMGGDEFCGLFPETASGDAQPLVEKLRARLLERMRQQGWPVTFSIGAATFGASREAPQEMIQAVDRLMYAVKKRGKDGVAFLNTGDSIQFS